MFKLIKKIDRYFSENYIKNFHFDPFVQVIMINKIFPNHVDMKKENGTWQGGINLEQFETFVSYFVSRDYSFIDHTDILNNSLDANSRYIYINFIGGYYNNTFCLDILEKYKIKATFFVFPDHIKTQKAYWWDVLYRKMNNESFSSAEILEKSRKMIGLKWNEQEDYLKSKYGEDVLKPTNDLNRPMTFSEFEAFAKHPYVVLGTIPDNYINLTLYSEAEIEKAITSTQNFIKSVSDQDILATSYPYGIYDDASIGVFRRLGYKIGITANKGKTSLVELADQENALKMNRTKLDGNKDIENQCNIIDFNFSFLDIYRRKRERKHKKMQESSALK